MKLVLASLLCIIFIFRTPSAIRNPRARVSWAATGLGGFGLLITNTFVPYYEVDQWLGGMNLAHLARSLLLSSAIWFLRSSIIQATGTGPDKNRGWKYHPLTLCMALGAITLPFMLADTMGSSSGSFVTAEGTQLGVFLYASIYMLFVGLVCLDCVWLLRGRCQGWLGVMRIGAITAAIASLDEIIYATAVWTSFEHPVFLAITFKAFNIIYLGVALIILSLAMLAIKHVQLVQRTVAVMLRMTVARYNRKQSSLESTYVHHDERSSDPRSTIYRNVIALKDIEAREGVRLGPITTLILNAGERSLTRPTPARTQTGLHKGNNGG